MSSRWDGPGTTPLNADHFPIKTIAVRVVEGPDAGKQVEASEDTLTIGAGEGNDLVLTDSTVSRYHAELSQHRAGIAVVDHDSTNGTFASDVRVTRGIIRPGTRLTIGRTKIEVLEGGAATVRVHATGDLGGIKGQAPVMRRLMAKVENAARSPSSVLLIGESGTGKELIAEAIHNLSPRADRPFVTVDCASLSPTLVASDLFGHERGAFTGAQRQHIGAFERADGGTIFLDELGELTPDLQTTLLGVLERRRFRRLGGSEEVGV
ncbi:MAG: sigma 54-interacting transcriptional regulator, partial [Deltaproteobacteria bacterium]|nr:sigma 54-interacting transcriptional regulator [Deltaproteobacteria bacterium]